MITRSVFFPLDNLDKRARKLGLNVAIHPEEETIYYILTRKIDGKLLLEGSLEDVSAWIEWLEREKRKRLAIF